MEAAYSSGRQDALLDHIRGVLKMSKLPNLRRSAIHILRQSQWAPEGKEEEDWLGREKFLGTALMQDIEMISTRADALPRFTY